MKNHLKLKTKLQGPLGLSPMESNGEDGLGISNSVLPDSDGDMIFFPDGTSRRYSPYRRNGAT
jgi:hypothetical protein